MTSMPEANLFEATITTSAQSPEASLTARIYTAEDEGVDAAITVSTALVDAGRAVDRRFGCVLQIDLGSGSLTTIPQSQFIVDSEVEDLRSWADQLQFRLIGDHWSPFITALIRSRAAVTLTTIYGNTGSEVTTQIFDGYVTSGSFDPETHTAQVVALDEAISHSEKLVAPYLAPNSGQKRDAFLLDLLSTYSVPVGDVDLGSLGKTEIVKPVSQAEVRIFDFIRDFVAPTGAVIFFAGGEFQARRYSTTEPIKRALLPHHVSRISAISPPPMSAPTRVIASTVLFEQDSEVGGDRTVVQPTRTFSTYAPRGAVAEQSGGSISPVSYSQPAATRETSRVVTTTTYRGNVMVFREVVEWGWYAPQCARRQLETDGTTISHLGGSIYQYADGTWRSIKVEKFQPIRIVTLEKFIDEENRVYRQVERQSFFSFRRRAIFVISGGLESFDSAGAVPITEAGECVEPYAEVLYPTQTGSVHKPSADQVTTTDYTIEDDGTISKETVVRQTYSAGARALETVDGTYVYGLTNKDWREKQRETFGEGEETVITLYDPIDEERYTVTRITRTANEGIAGGDSTQLQTGEGSGARPRPEQIQPTTKSQELRETVVDEVREDLVGQEIPLYLQQEYCQDERDVLEFARTTLRENSAWPIEIEMPLEGQIHKGDWIRLDGHDDIGLDDARVWVQGVNRNFQAYRQLVSGHYYPPEVA